MSFDMNPYYAPYRNGPNYMNLPPQPYYPPMPIDFWERMRFLEVENRVLAEKVESLSAKLK